jgi:hypothetical protein
MAAIASTALAADSASAQTLRERFQPRGTTQSETPTATDAARPPPRAFTEAPTGFDSVTNGYLAR